MLWYNLNGCPAKYAFNVGASLKSGFQRCGIFPFSPDIIRNTVQSHHEPEKMMRQIRQQEQEQDFEPMFELLRTRYGVTSDVDLNDFKEYLLLKQLGLTLGTALASAVQKTLFGEAPQKSVVLKILICLPRLAHWSLQPNLLKPWKWLRQSVRGKKPQCWPEES